MADFQDITLTQMDRKASRKSDKFPSTFDVAIGLSTPPPMQWIQVFNSVWMGMFYNMKRDAIVQGRNIIITCCLDEIEQHHMPHLSQAVVETNKLYKAQVAANRARDERARAAVAADKAELDALENRLNTAQ